ncbi:type IV secretory system conjugative DNA transfer family protein [Streptomyces sp. NPDC093509]|uniref:type IV secretory system conjugative DNA transfer family protein n=1 Tax=Streptomyces sp. NPDC093509 TaxID=3154982 RepID=UPI00344BD1DA
MTSTPTTASRPAATSTERGIAIASSVAPLIMGAGIPYLDASATFLATIGYGGVAALTTTNYMNRLPPGLEQHLPADILRAHSATMAISTLTSGVALAMGALLGPEGSDALMFGVADIANRPIPGIVSLGWLLSVAYVPARLRKILGRVRTPKQNPVLPTPTASPTPLTPAEEIAYRWHQIISNQENGTHKGQHIEIRTLSSRRWQGTITARAGQSVTVNAETVSSAYQATPYQVPAAWITITDGAHSGERHITVNLEAPAELDTSTLQGAWRKWAARSGGVMAGTHLEDAQTDPNTGGEVAYVVAGENLDKLPVPDRAALAGALRTNTLLCSYSPVPGNPRRGEVRLMKHNPLKEGVPFPGTHVLKISKGGYVQIGQHVSGFPARIQFVDPKLGAKHLFIAGVTGSGKGGLIQIVALADHVNGHAIIYADPKGSSNPDVETMACYSGLGDDGCMYALRVAYALMQWRIEESARLKMKNFIPTKDRPWVRVILDEAHVPLSELVEYRKEAKVIVEALAAKARSMGIILTLVNQAVNADKLGGSTPLRTNVIQGGSLVMLRTDSDQSNLVTTGFEGVDPGQIPPAWDVNRPLIYDENVALQDPESTYGLGYTLGPGGAAEMMRDFILESAAPYIDEDAVQYPADWPGWDNRHVIARTTILPDDEDESGEGGMATMPAPPKEPTADEKILTVLQEAADPMGEEINYLHKDDIQSLTKLTDSTLENRLSRLVKDNRIHRMPGSGQAVRGRYGLGPEPAGE